MLLENEKLVWMSSLNTVLKHPKLKNVTKTLLNEISCQTIFFFLTHRFQCSESLTKQALNHLGVRSSPTYCGLMHFSRSPSKLVVSKPHILVHEV